MGDSYLCCIAIDDINEDGSAEQDQAGIHFSKLFNPWQSGNFMPRKDGMSFWSCESNNTKHQNIRVLCLLFAAWSYEL